MRRNTHLKLILPSLTEATSGAWRSIKYSLFPPLGLATLAAYAPADWEITLCEFQKVQLLESVLRPVNS